MVKQLLSGRGIRRRVQGRVTRSGEQSKDGTHVALTGLVLAVLAASFEDLAVRANGRPVDFSPIALRIGQIRAGDAEEVAGLDDGREFLGDMLEPVVI